jgi:hypothetical protein
MSADRPAVRPAFVSRWGALGFCLLLAALLSLPLALPHLAPAWPYPGAGVHIEPGDFGFLQKMSAADAPDLDVAVIGDSLVLVGIDGYGLEQALTAQLGRPAHVAVFGFRHRGEEVYYVALRELLAHKRPKLIILDTSIWDRDEPHLWDYRMLRLDEGPEFYAGLSLLNRWRFYTQAVLGIPRVLLNGLRKPVPDRRPESYRGTVFLDFGYDHGPFKPIDFEPPKLPASRVLYSDDRRSEWEFLDRPYSPLAATFFEKSKRLIETSGVRLAIIDIPWYDARRNERITERFYWPKLFATPVDVLGVPPAQLYRGLSDDQIRLLYSDHVHYNANGAKYFTAVIAPAIAELLRR